MLYYTIVQDHLGLHKHLVIPQPIAFILGWEAIFQLAA